MSSKTRRWRQDDDAQGISFFGGDIDAIYSATPWQLHVPDFTRGGWKTANPLAIEGVDMSRLDFDRGRIDNSSGQMNI